MAPCLPKGDNGGVRRVVGPSSLVFAPPLAELTTTPNHPFPPAAPTAPITTPSFGASTPAPRTPSPPARLPPTTSPPSVRGRSSESPSSPPAPRGRRRARAPSPSPDRSKRVKTRAASPSPPPSRRPPSPVRPEPVRPEPVKATAPPPPPPTPSSVSSPSPFLRPAETSTPPATFSFSAAPPAAKPKPKSPWQSLLDEVQSAPPPEKPRAYPETGPPFGPTVRPNEPLPKARPQPLPSRFAWTPTQPAVASPPPPPPRDAEIHNARPLDVSPAAVSAFCAPRQAPCAPPPPPPPPSPPPPPQKPAVFFAPVVPPAPAAFLAPLATPAPAALFQWQQPQPQPQSSFSGDIELGDAQPEEQGDVDVPDAPAPEPEEQGDIELADAPDAPKSPPCTDKGELEDADNEAQDEVLTDAEPEEASADLEQLPDAEALLPAVEANPTPDTPEIVIPDAPSSPPTTPHLITRQSLRIRETYLKQSRQNPYRMGSRKASSASSPSTPSIPTSPASPTASRSASPTSTATKSVASSAVSKKKKRGRAGRQRRDQAIKKAARLAGEAEDLQDLEQKHAETEQMRQDIASMTAENGKLYSEQTSNSEHIASLEAQLAEKTELAESATKACNEAQKKADDLEKKLTEEVSADEATKQKLADVTAQLEAAQNTITALKAEKAKSDADANERDTESAFALDATTELASQLGDQVEKLQNQVHSNQVDLQVAHEQIISEGSARHALQQELDAKNVELDRQQLKVQDLNDELNQQKLRVQTLETELSQRRKIQDDAQSFQPSANSQRRKIHRLERDIQDLDEVNLKLQRELTKCTNERDHNRQMANSLGDLNRQLRRQLDQHVGKLGAPEEQQANPSPPISSEPFQGELARVQQTSPDVQTNVQVAFERMELDRRTFEQVNRIKDKHIEDLKAELTSAQAQLSERQTAMVPFTSSVVPPAAPIASSSAAAAAAAAPIPADRASTALVTMPSSSLAAASAPTDQQASTALVTLPCYELLESDSEEEADEEPSEPFELTSAQPSSSADRVDELLQDIEKARKDFNSRVDNIDGQIDALEASMNESRSRARASARISSIISLPLRFASGIGRSISSMGNYIASSIFGQPLHFYLLMLLFSFLLTIVAIGNSMQEELWYEVNTLSPDHSFNPAWPHIIAFAQTTMLVRYIIIRWRS
ncbi:hypothetical protein JOL62DRAFT_629045 [Phyllosticta paracitricarpa]|uniref:Uncharacterized protein n=2 Tax=Phyllosticta TaxID=121621 RepID=A0ABR1MK43_9PEZI